MAYNPFNIFRRNQKAIFAVVTVIIMFTFVLSSGLRGGADFFDWLPRWIGTKSKKGEVICTIDGDKIYQSELDKLRFQRVIANRYMSQGAMRSQAELDNYVQANAAKMSPEGGRIMDTALRDQVYLQLAPQQLMQTYGSLQFVGATHPMVIQNLRSSMMRILDLPNAAPLDRDLARVKLVSLGLLQSLYSSSAEQLYFANLPNKSNRDLVNFMLWQKKADQLGIYFSTKDVEKLIGKEFYNSFTDDAQKVVQKDLSQSISGFNINKCIEAVGEEFRVRTAQTALLGAAAHGSRLDKTFGGFPAFNPLYEIYDYYREECSPSEYGAIPVPAVNFIDKVKDPDLNNHEIKAELDDLFRKHMNDEPNFGREAPGFKIPRKVRINYISASPTDPYYVKKAEQSLKNEELAARMRPMMLVPILGMSPSELFNARALALDPTLAQAYEFSVLSHKSTMANTFGSSHVFFSNMLATSVVRPGVMASTAGSAIGQSLTFGSPLAAAAQMASAPFAYETRDRVQAGVPAVLLALGAVPGVHSQVFGTAIGQPIPGPLPGPSLFANLMNGAAAYDLMLPKPLPLDSMREELTKKLLGDKAKELVKQDLDTFIKEVNKLSGDGKVRISEKDKIAAIQKYITEFTDGPRFDSVLGLGLGLSGYQKNLPSRGIKVGGNKIAQSEWTLEEDPVLATLVKVQKDSLSSSPHSSRYIPFANSFFWQGGDRTNPTSTIYQPAYYPDQQAQFGSSFEEKPQYVVWRAEEVPAKLAASFDEAKPAVIAAWKRKKTREMAKERAEAIAKAIREDGTVSPLVLPSTINGESNKFASEFIADPKARDRIVPFKFEGVCPLTTVANPTASKTIFSISPPSMPFSQLMQFQLPPSEHVKYPSQEMYRELLAKRKDPPKTTMVLADEPKDIYFVVTLIDRKVKSDLEFQSAVLAATGPGGVRNVILGSFNQDAQVKTLDSVMGLLKKEFKYEETDEQKKKLDERRGSEQ